MQYSPSSSVIDRERLPVLAQRTTRRKFTRYSLFTLLGLGGLVSAVATAKMLYPNKVSGFGTKVVAGTVQDIKQQLDTKKYALNQEGKFMILPAEAGKGIAVYWKCVHLGCTVPVPSPALDGNIQCPCHGSLYKGNNGDLIHGPATRPLDWMPISIDAGNVIVDTGTINVRDSYQSTQSTALG